MLNRYLPDEVLQRAPAERRLTIGNLLAIGLIAFVLCGGITYMLPGAAYEPPAQRTPEPRPDQHDRRVVHLEGGCSVYLPHGKRRCAMGTLRGAVVYMEGY